MRTFANILRENRELKSWKLKEVAAGVKVDQALISKFEKGSRLPTEGQVKDFAGLYGLDFDELRKYWLVEKVLNLIGFEQGAREVLTEAGTRVEFLRSSRSAKALELSAELIEKLNEAEGLKENRRRNILPDPKRFGDLFENLIIEYTFCSNATEGNALTLEETNLVVKEGRTVGGKLLKTHLEVVNHIDAVAYLIHLTVRQEVLSQKVLFALHKIILRGIDPKNAGRFRTGLPEKTIEGIIAPSAKRIPKLMEEYFLYYLRQKNNRHPVLLAADMSARLILTQPFSSGNGQMSRLIMNLILLQNGYALTVLKSDPEFLKTYYEALNLLQTESRTDKYYYLIADAVADSLRSDPAMI